MQDDPDDAALRARYGPMLERERAALAAASEGGRNARAVVELDQQSVGRLSRMDALQGQAMAKGLEARRAGRLRAIAAALGRMDTGDYGWCEDCGGFIGHGRLGSDPCAPRCVECAGGQGPGVSR
ncbi:TraR/DksA family transcriptional regulator [Rhodobacterales bacterium HKCCE2091]|nr:TraR/DksA family transcriptional regulator [Rhodobacterales bacterium HKCCE2091]